MRSTARLPWEYRIVVSDSRFPKTQVLLKTAGGRDLYRGETRKKHARWLDRDERSIERSSRVTCADAGPGSPMES